MPQARNATPEPSSSCPFTASHDLARLYALRAWRDAQDVLAGLYHSRFTGAGLDFAELRDYQPGDDARHVHWPLSIRKDKLLSRVFQEERSTDLLLLVDASPSMRLWQAPWDCALRTAALLAACAISCQDAVGAMIFANGGVRHLAAERGKRQLPRILRDIMTVPDATGTTAISVVLEQALSRCKKRTRVVLVSDLVSDDFAAPLRAIARHHDLMLCHVFPANPLLPENAGWLHLADAENAGAQAAPAGHHPWREDAANAHRRFIAHHEELAANAKAEYLRLEPDIDPLPALVQHLAGSRRRRRT